MAAGGWRLAAGGACGDGGTTGSVRPRFYRLFQYVAGDGTTMARVLAESWGLRGKPWVLAIARTTWEFRKATINTLMVLADWNGEAA